MDTAPEPFSATPAAEIPAPVPATPPPALPRARPSVARRRVKQGLLVLGLLVLAYVAIAYLAAPMIWKRLPHPALEGAPKVTRTGHHIDGDPINVALIGSEEEMLAAFEAAGWHRADPLSYASRLRMVHACS